MAEYNVNNIQTLSFRDAVRTRLGMYLSADKDEALLLGIRELIYNSQDEYEMGYGTTIKISIEDNGYVGIEDDCRGIPCGVRKDGTNSLTAACSMPHTGGKMDDKVYSNVVGINGIGLKVVCLTAKEFDITVWRDGQKHNQRFLDGLPEAEVNTTKGSLKKTGTLIKYLPDPVLYEHKTLDIEELKATLKELSFFAKGLRFVLKYKGKTLEFYSKNGLSDALDKEHRIHTKILAKSLLVNDVKVEFALHWVKKGARLRSFANNLEVRDGGPFMTGFKTSLTKTFNSLSNSSFSGEIVRKYLDGYVAVKVKEPQFSNQSKTALANKEAQTATSKAIAEVLKEYVDNNPNDFQKIIDTLEKEQKAEEAAEKARNTILSVQKTLADSTRKKSILASKLSDCKYHNEESQLILCEGKSAGGNIINSRDSDHTACLPLQGKIINALKNDSEDVLENKEVQDLLIAMGCGIGSSFNVKKLRYGRVVIMADADHDGMSIMCLLLTFFYKYTPELLTQGKIFWAKTPLFKYAVNGKYFYANNEVELKQLQKQYKGGDVKRIKGLGELQAVDFKNTIFSDKGEYVRFTMNDVDNARIYFNMLLGKDIDSRREYIFNNIDFEKVED